LRDVATAAGVSTATVSLIVNGKADQYGIAPATRQRVEALVRQMNYTPSLAAREMAAGRNPLIGLAIADGAPATDHLITAIQVPLAQAGYRLIITQLPADPGTAATLIDDFMHAGIAGLIYCPSASGTGPTPDADCPTIAIGKPVAGLPAVYEDECEAGRRLARRLLDKGHRAIAILGTTALQPLVVAGFLEACAQSGVTPRLFSSVADYLPQAATLPAVFCLSSAILIELYCQAAVAGHRPGTDLAVVAADDQAMTPHLTPRPVAYQPNTPELGAVAARLIQQAIRGATPGEVRLEPTISGDVRPQTPDIRPQTSEPKPIVESPAVPKPVVVPIPVIPISRPVVPTPDPSPPGVAAVPSGTVTEPAPPVLPTQPVEPVATPELQETVTPTPPLEPVVVPEPVIIPEPVVMPDPVTEPVIEAPPTPIPDPVAPPEPVIAPVAEPLPEPAPVPEPVAEPLPEPAPETPVEVAPPPEPVPEPPVVEPEVNIVPPPPEPVATPPSPVVEPPAPPPETPPLPPPMASEPVVVEPDPVTEESQPSEPEAPSDLA